MKMLSSVLLAASLLVSSHVFGQGAKDVADARAATESWMKFMDAEEYTAAWNGSSEGMRKGIPKLAWNMLASTTHLPLGKLKSRTYQSADIRQGGAGKGDRIEFTYRSQYEKGPVKEAVTAVHEADGVWRVTGYTINDAQK